MKISVLIITRERQDYLKDCFSSLLLQTKKPNEVVIVDSSLGLASEDVCREFGSKLNIKYKKEKPLGIAHARNTALTIAKGDILAFFDDDCVPEENWLEEILRHFKKYPETDILLGRCRNYYPENIFANIQQVYYDRWLFENLGDIRKRQKVNIKTFCDFENIAIRREFIKDYRCSTDLPFCGWNEDLEMGSRLAGKGNFFYDPEMIIYHKHKNSFRELFGRNYKEGIADEQVMEEKNITTRVLRSREVELRWLKNCQKETQGLKGWYRRSIFWFFWFLYPYSYRLGRQSYKLIKVFKK